MTSAEDNSYIVLLQQFENWVCKTPDKAAVIFQDEEITYKNLNHMICLYSKMLVDKNLSRGQVIGIHMNRSTEMIALMFAAWICECGFILIDKNLPHYYKQKYIQIANLAFVVSDNCEIHPNPAYSPCESHHQPAYCIFTSGSSGEPKGVCISADSLAHAAVCLPQSVSLCKDDLILAMSSLSFDLIFFETALALCNGLTVVLANQNQYINSRLLVNLIEKYQVSVIQTVPSRLLLLQTSRPDLRWMKSIKTILLGGEIISQQLIEKTKLYADAKIFNMYGLTEDTIWTTATEITDADNIHISNPIQGHRIYLMKNSHTRAQPGEEGQIYLSGAGLCGNYLNIDMKLTPIYVDGERIWSFATGDYAIREHDFIKFMGRKDNQIKINGIKVCVEEIESQINSIDTVKRSVVHYFMKKNGAKVLCAFYEAKRELSDDCFRSYLAQSLPKYMVPSHYFYSSSLPSLLNGKVKRNDPYYKNLYLSQCFG